jgi:hypothetical protein
MVNLMTNGMKKDILDQYFVNNTIEAILVMNTTTVDTDEDGIAFVNDYTLLDECDGANYARKSLANKVAATDDVNDEGELDFDDLTYLALGNGTRPLAGVVLIRKVTNDLDSPAGIFLGFPGDTQPGGGDFTIRIPVGGAILAQQAAVV